MSTHEKLLLAVGFVLLLRLMFSKPLPYRSDE
jgi:hypothetical protein